MAPPVAKQYYYTGFAPLTVSRNRFTHKSLSSWAVNIAVGCSHACRFCYVPDASAIKRKPELRNFGVEDPDAEWGDYVILRPFDEKKFAASVRRANRVALEKVNFDGNRAVIYCSTTDPYQVFPREAGEKRRLLEAAARRMVRRSLEIIRDQSDLNVRILTRSPLAERDFDLFKSFGSRLVFGMSLPTLNDALCRAYEPKAPGVMKRLETMQKARGAGLHVYVAMAPTYPDCDEADLRVTLEAIRELNPITVFHEPINLRAKNVERIETYARTRGMQINTAPLKSREAWRIYAIDQLRTVQRIARELGLETALKLWPDAHLGSESGFLRAAEYHYRQHNSLIREGRFAKRLRREQAKQQFLTFKPWLEYWWNKVSAWPA